MTKADTILRTKTFPKLPVAAHDAVQSAPTDTRLIKSTPVIESLDIAMEVLFGYSEFREASFDLFIRLTEGKLTHEEEQMLNALGITKFLISGACLNLHVCGQNDF